MNHFKTKITGLTIRFATEKDLSQILYFIRKLAEYEQLGDEVVADIKTLQKSLFGSMRTAEVIIADFNKKPVGFALFFHNFSTFLGKPGLYIEDLFVNDDQRGNGIGGEILSFLAQLAIERGCGRLEWWVLDWNETAIKFYKKMGAAAMDDWTVYRISGQKLIDLAGRRSKSHV
jgi:GNAT superfamily N-acetyltransferase